MFDTAIIGAGPAGLSAAINLKIYNKNFIWFGSKKMSDKVRLSEKIANYPGFPYTAGSELAAAFEQHRQQMELEISDKMVSQIMPTRKGYTLLADNELYEAKTVILALGVMASKEIPGERALVGRGISYCATCDGFLYKGKRIGILCTSGRFEHEVKYLVETAQKVYFFPYYKSPCVSGGNIEFITQKIAAVNGGEKFESVTLADGTTISFDGLFCLRDCVAPTALLPKIATEKDQILVDRTMAANLPGLYACGDCTGAPYQIAKAVGEGNVAAHSVIHYLSELGKSRTDED